MKLETIARELDLTDLTPALAGAADAEVDRRLRLRPARDVLANAPEGGVLVTLQVHLNVIAVASHAELAAVIFASGRAPDDEVVAKATPRACTSTRPPPTPSRSSAACTPWA